MFTAMRLLFGLLVILYHHGEKKMNWDFLKNQQWTILEDDDLLIDCKNIFYILNIQQLIKVQVW